MIFTSLDYQVIDISKPGRSFSVACEATSREEVSKYLAQHGLKCEMFKEQGEEIYRGICPAVEVISDERNRVRRPQL